MSLKISPLEEARRGYRPRIPAVLAGGTDGLRFTPGEPTGAAGDEEEIRRLFPHTFGRPLLRLGEGPGPTAKKALRVGVVLSGGQAPGGHNVIAGLGEALFRIHPESKLFGFLGGPKGVLTGRYEVLPLARLEEYRNTGGFDMICSGRDKIESAEHLQTATETCRRLDLDGLVIVGGDDSNTNAAVLAEHFQQHGVNVSVNGVPKTIDGDLRGRHVEMSFGFDTACRVYSELIGNICRDAKSAGKYWHFVKMMGRSASHVTLECALQTHANVALIGEEIRERGLTLRDIVSHLADIVRRRAEAGRPYGVCLIPEGLIEFIPEISTLIAELNDILHEHARYFETIAKFTDKQEFVNGKLGKDSSYAFSCLPALIQSQLLLDRDAHGNVQVSRINTEKLLQEMVEERIAEQRASEGFDWKFQVQAHFLGYEGRCSAPSNFDADYTYGLGALAAMLTAFGHSGYVCALSGLTGPAERWQPAGVPLTSLMHMETRKGRPTPVIGKALVRLDDKPFRTLTGSREQWELEDHYVYPGPIQYFGPQELCDVRPLTLELERDG